MVIWVCSTDHFPGVDCDNQVSQTPLLNAEEGQDITLRCNHSVKSYQFLAWYKQLPGSSLQICASGVLEANNICRVTMSIDKNTLTTRLSINRVRIEESATYYCAVSDTVKSAYSTAVLKPISSHSKAITEK
ncbi:hypothetical protein GDO86_001617 [Hymenochirus boettgeri]|uniref:Ig-like domain-containing protein n=1 Tax=Hymenochirus boettgeri TaxID=247094 RepID=A0A8T2KM90_9PIPI|nr:hypothetical protein GDO86_001617 [Hymenochirus boettgeri]